MLIKGFQKLTLLDYPGKTACTVFTGGCNFRCPFCHNAGLVTRLDTEIITESEIFEHLKKRQGILDGIAITGGEPLLQGDIEEFLSKVREYDYAIKLDTNGSFPQKLKSIIEKGLCDYVAMDIKNSKEKYPETVGIDTFDLSAIEESVEILKESSVPFEFRTTVTKNFHTIIDIENIGKWIAGTENYYLQNFVDSGNLIDSNVEGVSKAEMEEMLEAVKKYVATAEIRGI
ncbi:MAG: anaerobic ribonucleoside-triphosphate reductase activating protein [Ruminococcaceae bacterium]|nr:anaerobic ribonucleoside-triphosphate reductase activating protein [Oscillospiraceae bacterium]